MNFSQKVFLALTDYKNVPFSVVHYQNKRTKLHAIFTHKSYILGQKIGYKKQNNVHCDFLHVFLQITYLQTKIKIDTVHVFRKNYILKKSERNTLDSNSYSNVFP